MGTQVRVTVTETTPIEALYRLPVVSSAIAGMRLEGISYPPFSPLASKNDPQVIEGAKNVDKLHTVHGPYRLRRLLKLSRRDMCRLLSRYMREPSKQAMIGWEKRERAGVIDKYMIGRKAREAYWRLIEDFTREVTAGEWYAVIDRRRVTYWRVELRRVA